MLRNIVDLLRSFAILYFMLFLGQIIAHTIPVGIPSSIWGLLLLFLALLLGIIKVQWIQFSANLLIRYMALLFVPVSVGIIKYADVLLAQLKVLLIPNIVSSFITLIIVALLSDYLFSLYSFRTLRQKVLKKRINE